MRFVSLSYVRTKAFTDPVSWLERVKAYGKVWEALAKKQSIISIEQIDYEGKYDLNGVQYLFIRGNRKFPFTLHRLVKKLQPDVVIVHGLGFSYQVLQLRSHLEKKTIILAQHHADRIPTGWRRWIGKIADRAIDAYLFASVEIAAPWIRKNLIGDKNKIKEVMVGSSIFNPMNQDVARKLTGVKGQPVFLFVGRLDANKDPLTLIKGFLVFAQNHPSASVYIIYQTDELIEEVRKLLSGSGGSKNINLVGRIPHPELQNWFSSADFIISTSHAEAFGMSISEGMSCGCIPVVTNIASFKKLTNDGDCGILFEAGNVEGLAGALEKATSLDLEEERKKVLRFYNQMLSPDSIADQIINAAASTILNTKGQAEKK